MTLLIRLVAVVRGKFPDESGGAVCQARVEVPVELPPSRSKR